jgi:hypothetical protein
MTIYTVRWPRPGRLPLPDYDPARPTAAMRQELEAFVQQVEGSEKQLDLACESLGHERPGIPADHLLTDVEYAKLMLSSPLPIAPTTSEASVPNDERGEPAACIETVASAALINAPELELQTWAPPKFGSLTLHDGYTLMSSQVLRSRVFQSPPLDTWLCPLGESSAVQMRVGGFSPTTDHHHVLLFAISLISGQPDPKLGAAVQFSTGRFIAESGWARNSRSYERLSTLIDELKQVRLTFRKTADESDLVVVSDAPLLAGVTEGQQGGKTELWQLVLTTQLLALFGLERNTLLEMRAYRALHETPSAVALYGLIASQRPGVVRKFDVREICAFCGLVATRDEDNRKALKRALQKLMAPAAVGGRTNSSGATKSFEPVLAAWSFERTARGWVLAITRSHAFFRQ